MKKNREIWISLLFGMIGMTPIFAQTTNTGDFQVLPGTVVSIQDEFTNTGMVINDGEIVLLSDIENNGVFNNSAALNTGVITLFGSVPQFITGTTPLILNDMVVDNTSGEIALENTLRINGTTSFNLGVVSVDPSSGALFFERLAMEEFASNASYVEGLQQKRGDTEFTFPSGENGYYRPAYISSPVVATDAFSCVYRHSNSDLVYPHTELTGVIEQINNTEYWELDRETGASNVVVGLSYEDGVTPSFITDNLDRVHVVRWDENFNAWVSEGGVHDAQTSMIYTVAKVNGYGVYTLAVVNSDALSGEEVEVYNLITPNGNGQNDWAVFDGLENFEDNQVVIVNRWGEAVFEMSGYDNVTNVFKGYANKGITNTNVPLPDGTYYYVITYTNTAGEAIKKVGYLHLAGN